MSEEVNLAKIQDEQNVWAMRNFGITPAHRPLLGLIEELGELDEAVASAMVSDEGGASSKEAILDAVGDVGIYMLDYCNKSGWRFAELWAESLDIEQLDETEHSTYFMRKLAHHRLKGEQNIRGGTAHHDAELKSLMPKILYLAAACCTECGTTFPEVLAMVWSKVSKRDWNKNPNDAHAVAEGSS